MARTPDASGANCFDVLTLNIVDSAPCQLQAEDSPTGDLTPGDPWEATYLYYRGFKPHKTLWGMNWYETETLRDAANTPNSGTQIAEAQRPAVTFADTVSNASTPEHGNPIPPPGQARRGVRILRVSGTVPSVKPDGTSIGPEGTSYYGKLWLYQDSE